MAAGCEEIYRYLRLAQYKKLFATISEKPGSLSATEAFSVEVIYLLDKPTIGEFAEFLGISQPNASYKVVSLVSKGYVKKQPCKLDKRECQLIVTDKFLDYYGHQVPNISGIVGDLSDEEKAVLRKLSAKISRELSKNAGTVE